MNAAGKQVAIFVRAGARYWFAVAGLGLFVTEGAAHAQSPSSRQIGHLYRHFCVKCHGADGTGNAVRDQFPKIPDFTKARWQMARSNPQLLVSIREGKGIMMPPFGDRLSGQQTSDLVAFIRAFGKAKGSSSDTSTKQGKTFPDLSSPFGSRGNEHVRQSPVNFIAGFFGETHGLFDSLGPVQLGTPEGNAEVQRILADFAQTFKFTHLLEYPCFINSGSGLVSDSLAVIVACKQWSKRSESGFRWSRLKIDWRPRCMWSPDWRTVWAP
jgi:cytochrome c553